MGLIPARKSVAISVQQGQHLKVTNTHGKQVIDFWAFNPNDKNDHLSTTHTRSTIGSISLRVGDNLYSSKRKPILKLVQDITPGVHDLLWAACDAERYRLLGASEYHDNCHDNLLQALKEGFPQLAMANDDVVPDPLNLFMNVVVNHRGGLDIQPPVSERGQYVVLEALCDLVVVMSACPQDMASTNAGKPTDCEYDIYGSDNNIIAADNLMISQPLAVSKPTVKVALSVDFDALSGWLGTGHHPDNNMADYSAGIFAAQVGYQRLLDVLAKHGISDRVSWFIPGHTIETFPEAVQKVVDSGAEIGLHGYAHEDIGHMSIVQERDVLDKCIELVTKLCGGKKPRGYRAPLYTVRESTVELLREREFLYDSSLTYHDSQPYWTPSDPPIETIDYTKEASSWLKPSVVTDPSSADANPLRSEKQKHPLVEIPANWYTEDMTPMQFFQHIPNSAGYIGTTTIEQMWKDRFVWLFNETAASMNYSDKPTSFIFPVLLHPDTSGMAHIVGMVDRMIGWLQDWGACVQFMRHDEIAMEWLEGQRGDMV